jgi:hypothetical protein
MEVVEQGLQGNRGNLSCPHNISSVNVCAIVDPFVVRMVLERVADDDKMIARDCAELGRCRSAVVDLLAPSAKTNWHQEQDAEEDSSRKANSNWPFVKVPTPNMTHSLLYESERCGG